MEEGLAAVARSIAALAVKLDAKFEAKSGDRRTERLKES